jgi:hypothetical protein
VADLLAMVPSKVALKDFLKVVDKRFEEEAASTQKFLEKVLQLGADWIISDNLDDCPLCEQPIERDVVLSSIRKRLQENERLA